MTNLRGKWANENCKVCDSSNKGITFTRVGNEMQPRLCTYCLELTILESFDHCFESTLNAIVKACVDIDDFNIVVFRMLKTESWSTLELVQALTNEEMQEVLALLS